MKAQHRRQRCPAPRDDSSCGEGRADLGLPDSACSWLGIPLEQTRLTMRFGSDHSYLPASLGTDEREHREHFPGDRQISPRFAKRAMCSPARNASAWMVIVGWPRPDVTRLLPSHTKRFRTSWLR